MNDINPRLFFFYGLCVVSRTDNASYVCLVQQLALLNRDNRVFCLTDKAENTSVIYSTGINQLRSDSYYKLGLTKQKHTKTILPGLTLSQALNTDKFREAYLLMS